MKYNKISALLLAAALMVGTAGCTQQPSADTTSPSPSTTVTQSVQPSTTPSATPSTTPSAEPQEEDATYRLAPTLYSETLKLDWNYTIYLPRGYDDPANADKTYPVIYLLHGAFGNHRNLVERFSTPEIMDSLIESGQMPEAIVVFPDGFNSYYIDGPALDMESAFINDLFPTIESLYRADTSKEGRIIGGISMGGYGAARFALKYPELFSAALLISPAVWAQPTEGNDLYDNWHVFPEGDANFSQSVWESFYPTSYLEDYTAKNSPVSFYVISGDADTTVDISEVQNFYDQLLTVAPDAQLSVEPDGVHAWTFWEPATTKALQFAGSVLQGQE